MRTPRSIALVLFFLGCAGSQEGASERDVPVAEPGQTIDILLTTLDFNVKSKTASAVIEFADLEPSASSSITLEKGDLQIESVADASGPLEWKARGDKLDIGVPTGTRQLRVAYRYSEHPSDEGALASKTTRIWPTHCGNLFPCNSSPGDGAKYRMALSGLTPDENAVYPTTIPEDAPSYMVAWAVGDYEYTKLGETKAGTEVGIYYTEKTRYPMRSGTYSLLNVFGWLEEKLGPYPFGNKVASVAVDWGADRSAGMEYHPYWHVTASALGNQMVHIHEAAHGWYGNGVRIACWEDYILSEGVVSYLTARALEEKSSRYYATQLWRNYERMVKPGVVWPKGCNENDVKDFGTSSLYARGALFFRSVEKEVGRVALDGALASFYVENRGKAARFDALLDHIKAATKTDVRVCAEGWLRSDARDYASSSKLCRF